MILDPTQRHRRDCRKCSIIIVMRPVCYLFLALSLQAAAGQSPKQAPSVNADELLSSGIAAQQHHDYKTAIEDYRKVLALQPGLTEARVNLGAALAEAGDFDAAIEEDTRALSAAHDKIAVRRNLALAYYKKGDFLHARLEFEAVHAARPTDLSAAILLGYVYIKLDKEEEAAKMLAPLEPGHESDMDFEYVLGYAMIQTEKQVDGLTRMEKVAQATRSADAYVIAGSARLHRREFHEARADLDKALELDPTFPGANTLAGQARDALGDSDAALPAFQAALRADPKDFMANLYLGTMRLKQRDIDSARPLLELALALQPTYPLARFQMAKLNGMTGKYEEAAKTLEDLARTDPNWLDPHVELATIYYKLHRPEDGQRERDTVQRLEAQQQKAGPPKQ
jgi:tetratricopeptide (TPR) repeat protein